MVEIETTLERVRHSYQPTTLIATLIATLIVLRVNAAMTRIYGKGSVARGGGGRGSQQTTERPGRRSSTVASLPPPASPDKKGGGGVKSEPDTDKNKPAISPAVTESVLGPLDALLDMSLPLDKTADEYRRGRDTMSLIYASATAAAKLPSPRMKSQSSGKRSVAFGSASVERGDRGPKSPPRQRKSKSEVADSIDNSSAAAAALTPARLAAAAVAIVTKVFDVYDMSFYCSKAKSGMDLDVLGSGAGGMDLALLSASASAAQALCSLPWVCAQVTQGLE